jgi:hypothetical protein
MPATPKDPSFRCRRCHSQGLTSTLRVERGVQKRRRDGRLRECVTVTCSRGHEWWSTANVAIARSRKRDARANLKLQDAEAVPS